MITQGQRIGWRGALIFPADYFGDSGVTATLVGVEADAQAGGLSATGVASAEIASVQAQSAAGALSADGDGLAVLAGVFATAQAGELGASTPAAAFAAISGVQATASAGWLIASVSIPQQQGGGAFMRRNAVPAVVALRGVSAKVSVGRITARQGNAAKGVGALASASAGRVTATGTATIQLKAARLVVMAGRRNGIGTWPITDEELMYALLYEAA